MGKIILKKDKEKSVLSRHPWIFSGAVKEYDSELKSGDIVDIISYKGDFLARGYFEKNSQIVCRILTFDYEEKITPAFFMKKIKAAFEFRKKLIPLESTNAFRVINSEGDNLSGLIVDDYNGILCVQYLTEGMQKLKDTITESLIDVIHPIAVYEKDEFHHGKLFGNYNFDNNVIIKENNIKFLVNIPEGQKTGFFLDQRDNRYLAGKYSKGRNVLNCFSYTGGFSLYAAVNGAVKTTSIDISDKSIEICKENFKLNGLDIDKHEFIVDDVFQYLRKVENNVYDFIILDPPAFVKNKASLATAYKGYKDINLNAMKKIAKNGLIFTFSCSHHMDINTYKKILFKASLDSDTTTRILTVTSNAPDHPVGIYHPEGEYLKGILLSVEK